VLLIRVSLSSDAAISPLVSLTDNGSFHAATRQRREVRSQPAGTQSLTERVHRHTSMSSA
jgi:hypothetical protein